MSAHRIIISVTLANKVKFYKVRLNDSIKDIKIKIQDKEGFPVKFQNLFFNTQLLENDKTLSDYKIPKNSNLDLTLKVDEKILIFIQTISGQKITFSLNKNIKIEQLKRKIQKKELINEKFMLKYHNILLEDGKTLEDYKIANNSIIYLYLNEIFEFVKIYVNFSNRKIWLNIINDLSKIKDIKIKLSRIIDIPYSELVLYLNDMILDDNKIVNLDIDDDYTFKLFIKTKNKDSLEDKVKEIKQLFENRKREISNQFLDFEKNLNNNKILGDYSSESRPYDHEINIFLKHRGRTFLFIFDVFRTVGEFKKKIFQQKKISNITLTYAGKILQDEFTLAKYNVQNNSTIFSI